MHTSNNIPIPVLLAALQHGAIGAKGLCVGPAGGAAAAGKAAVLSAAGCSHKHAHPQPSVIQHKLSGLCLQPAQGSTADGTPLVYGSGCASSGAAFTNLATGAMVHLASGKCLAPQGGAATPTDGTALVLSTGCSHALLFSIGPFPAGAYMQRMHP